MLADLLNGAHRAKAVGDLLGEPARSAESVRDVGGGERVGKATRQ